LDNKVFNDQMKFEWFSLSRDRASFALFYRSTILFIQQQKKILWCTDEVAYAVVN